MRLCVEWSDKHYEVGMCVEINIKGFTKYVPGVFRNFEENA
jgi:hypothetical protein